MISLLFLVLGGGFVGTLLQSLMVLIGTNWDKESFTAGKVISVFKWPIFFLIMFVLFIMVGLPYMEKNS